MSKKLETNKLPFHRKLFYLDITSNPTLKTKLECFVKQLGGTVETFLDRKVRYVVTDKPQKDWPVVNKDSKQVITAEKQENKLDLMSLTRGKMLATKTPSSSAKTKDVLDTALKLNMKILTHRSILDFCRKHMKVTIDEISLEQMGAANLHNTDQDKNSMNSLVKIKIRQLKAPFLKFEDQEEKFSPVYKEFEKWPSICIDSSSSSLTNNTNITNNHNQTQAVPKNFNTSKLLQPLHNHKKRQRIYFCEICSKEFTNMIEHVKTEQHQDYMKNEENYKELRSVIESLPNWTTLNDTSAFDENDEITDEESDFEDECTDEGSEDDAYSSEFNKTNLSEDETNNKPNVINSDHMVPASFTTPIKLFKLNNIFNNIKRDECEN